MDAKKITQIITYYNEEKYIAACIQSLLNQTYQNLEIIAISDGSTDNGPEIVASFDDSRIVMINNPDNHGQGYCRNQGLDMATGDYVGFFDGDDISHLNRLEFLASYLDSHEDIFCVSCDYECIDENGNIYEEKHPKVLTDINEIRANFLIGCPVGCSCALFRRKLVEEYHIRELVGCKTAEDYHFWLQCLPYARFVNVDMPLFYYRQHNSQSKIAEKSNVNKHQEWMEYVFKFAWESRGFEISDMDIEFVYTHLYKCNLLWWPHDIVKAIVFRKKIAKQLSTMKLVETNEIVGMINERLYILIPYLFPIRFYRRHRKMLVNN